MNIFEWLIERRKPNAVGKLSTDDLDEYTNSDISFFWQIIIIILGVCGIGFIIWLVFIENSIADSWQLLIGIVVYLFVARFITAKPNMRNLGLFGGLMNHPFRYTDNLNRMLFFIQTILMPGKIIIASIYILLKYLKR